MTFLTQLNVTIGGVKMNDFEPIDTKDYLKQFSIRKQKAMNRLLMLSSSGIPAIHSSLSREDLMMVLNLLMFRALNGYYQYKCENMTEYVFNAVRSFKSLMQTVVRIKTGARVQRDTVYAHTKTVSTFIPVHLFAGHGCSISDDIPEYNQEAAAAIHELLNDPSKCCSNCNGYIDTNFKYCPECGSKVE